MNYLRSVSISDQATVLASSSETRSARGCLLSILVRVEVEMAEVRRITPSDRVEGDPTAGMIREEAFSTERSWAGLVRTAPQMTSGWHHHGDNETTIYVLSGACRLECGPGGREVIEGSPGDFMLIPAHTIHRESNPWDGESHLIVVRSGHGRPTFNVEGPEPLLDG
jgi:uncharacterized RmlC-like cupin family protein